MTQAHKTPGAIVTLHPEIRHGKEWWEWGYDRDTGDRIRYHPYEHMFDRVFEVKEECIPGHLTVVDVDTGEVFGGHDENFITMSGLENYNKKHGK